VILKSAVILTHCFVIEGMKGETHISRIDYRTKDSSKSEKPMEEFGNGENVGKIIDLKNP